MTKRKIVFVVLLGLMLLFVQGCASITKTMTSWVGAHISDLYLSWGPPTQTMSDGREGSIVSYYYSRNFGQIPGQAVKNNYTGSISYTAPRNLSYTAERHFYANSDGIIYSWRWRGR